MRVAIAAVQIVGRRMKCDGHVRVLSISSRAAMAGIRQWPPWEAPGLLLSLLTSPKMAMMTSQMMAEKDQGAELTMG